MTRKYAGAVLKAGKVAGSKRYIASPKKARLVKNLMKQAAEKASHGGVIQVSSSEIYRDDLIEAIIEACKRQHLKGCGAGNDAWQDRGYTPPKNSFVGYKGGRAIGMKDGKRVDLGSPADRKKKKR